MIELAIKRPTLVVALFAVLSIVGMLSYFQLNTELLPKFSAPIVTITTIYPGASPSEVENGVTKPIEDAISTLESIRFLRSISIDNFSIVTVALTFEADPDLRIQEAQRKLNAITSELPPGARTPTISKISSDDWPIMNIGATSSLSGTAFYDLMETRVLPALTRLDGVGQINLLGGQKRVVQVNVRLDKLEQNRISILQVLQAIRKANLEFPTGKLKNDQEQIQLRLAGTFQSLEELEQLIIFKSPLGTQVQLYEVAEILDTQEDVEDLTRVNGLPAIGLSVLKQSDANAVDVSTRIQAQLKELEGQFEAENLQFSIATNTTDFTIEAVNSVFKDLILAIILVAVVMLFFLHSFRNALIVMISIPASLVVTIIVMNVMGYTINVLSLLAMSLVIGILVDDSIVVLENIFRHIEMGKSSKQAALDGSKEIFLTALSITLVLVVVFIPLIVSSGIVAIIMQQFAVIVAVSILMSLFVSYTIAPALAARLPQQENTSTLGQWIFGGFEKGLQWLAEQYAQSLKASLRYPVLVLLLALGLLAASALLITEGFIGTAFLSIGDRGEFIIQLELPKSATFSETNRTAKQVEAYLFEQLEVQGVFTLAGRQTGFLSGGRVSSNLAEVSVKLVDKNQRALSTSLYAIQTKKALAERLPGVKIKSSEASFFGSAGDVPIQVIVSGTDYAIVQQYADSLLTAVKMMEGTIESELSTGTGTPQIDIQMNRPIMEDNGLDMQIVGYTLAVAFGGNSDAKYREGGREYDIQIQLDAFDRTSREDIANLTFLNKKGQQLKLSQFASITPSTGPALLQRYNRVPAIIVQSQSIGRPIGDIGADITAWLANHPPPPGLTIDFGGDLKRQAESFASLGLIFGASLLFIYLILVALYDSYLDPFAVLFSIPVALIGALLALALVMESLNIFSIIGIIMLNGLVAKNAILLVDFVNQLQQEGKSKKEALVEAGLIRLRPILMTAISIIFGMIPIALASGAASEWKNGLAWTLIGGLTSSTLLTLYLVPAVYLLLNRLKTNRKI
ncbi:MAG: efflux RND transporter permease subunit [Bacteroidota bacterium]